MKRPKVEVIRDYVIGNMPIGLPALTKDKMADTIIQLTDWILYLEKQEKERPETPEAVELIKLLNEKTGSKYPASEPNIKPLRNLIKTYGAVKVKQVIVYKCREWGSDAKWREYLTPKTLFSAKNFATYVGKLG